METQNLNPLQAFRKMLNETHEIKQIAETYNYVGPEITHSSILCFTSNCKDSFTKEDLDYHKERGRDFIDVILSKMYELGYNDAKIEGDKLTQEWIRRYETSVEISDNWRDRYLELKSTQK